MGRSLSLFGKKGDADDDRSRKGLFGSRDKTRPPAAPTTNPYANQAQRPVDPYTQAKVNAGLSPPSQNSSDQSQFGNLPNQSNGNIGGYSANRYGNEGGYGGPGNSGAPRTGGNPYGSEQQAYGSSRQGGYGGLGPTTNYDDDQNRGELFGSAQDRLEQKRQNRPPPEYNYTGGEDADGGRSYGAYGDRQLTAEEEEEEDIQATKQDIRDLKQQTVASSRNMLATIAQAEETGRNTLARLGTQGEMLHNTNRNMDLAQSEITNSKEKTDALKRYNRSMFIPAENPFQSRSAKDKRDQKIMDRHIEEREQREEGRMAAFRHEQGMQQNFQALARVGAPVGQKKNLASRAKYQFEADEEDDAMEDEIEENLDRIETGAGVLHALATKIGTEIDEHNKMTVNIGMKSDRVDNSVHMQTERLKRIK